MRRSLAAGLLASLCIAATAAEATGPWGLRVGNGTKVDLEFPPYVGPGESDDFVIDVVRGQRISAEVQRWERRLTWLALFRSDGREVTAAEGATVVPRSDNVSLDGSLTFTADATDTYRFRLESATFSNSSERNPESAQILFRATPRPAVETIEATPDVTGEVRFRFAARGGARLTLEVRPAGGTVTVRDLLDAQGRSVPEAVTKFRKRGSSLRLTRFKIPTVRLFGDFELVLDSVPDDVPSSVRLTARVQGGGPKIRKRIRLDAWDPGLVSVTPVAAVAGTVLTLTGDFVPAGTKRPSVRAFLGAHPLENVSFPNQSDLRVVTATVPAGLAFRAWDVVVEAPTGQTASLGNAVTTVPLPVAKSFDPPIGPSFGGFETTIFGRGFRPGRIGIRIDRSVAPAVILDATPTSVRFLVPSHPDGNATFGVVDLDTGATSDVGGPFIFTTDPVLTRIEPPLVPQLGGVTVTLRGGNFFPGTHVFLESDTAPGTFTDVTPGGSYVNSTTLRFTAPVRPRGIWRLLLRNVDDPGGEPSAEEQISYFSFADATASLGLATTGSETFDAWTSALADFDGDGDSDLFLSRRGSGTALTASQTRVLRNDGAGALTDVTADVMPAVAADDDWRADRIATADVDEDGRPDLVLATNDVNVPALQKSHVRIFVNEPRSGGAATTDRVFRDRTLDLFPPPRTMTRAYPSSGTPPTYVADDWRGLDLWIGDIDASGGRPEIVITHDETKDDGGATTYDGVFCTPYCFSPYSGGYAYRMYWGGTRAFRWDPQAAAGRGRYKFDIHAFPRRAGLTISIFGAPPGVTIPACNGQSPCRGKFPPMIGKRLAVGRIDGDAAADVVVLHDGGVTQSANAISPLQVVLSRPDLVYGAAYADFTPVFTAIGTDLTGQAVAAGRLSDVTGSDSIVAFARSSAASGSALRLFHFVPGPTLDEGGSFEEVTATALPPPTADERWQADSLEFRDVDGDGARDLVLLSASAPASGTALRILRADHPPEGGVRFVATLATMLGGLGTPGERFDGAALTIGDLDGDGLAEFVMSRAAPTGAGTQTRAVRIER